LFNRSWTRAWRFTQAPTQRPGLQYLAPRKVLSDGDPQINSLAFAIKIEWRNFRAIVSALGRHLRRVSARRPHRTKGAIAGVDIGFALNKREEFAPLLTTLHFD
jgi:hypothetical protein